MSVAHLHVHSEYSLLDGACRIDSLAERAAAYGQPALGLTDHGVMNGAVEHYKACKKHGIKPIMGLEAYYVDDRKTDAVRYERNHLTLIARDDQGFRNLVKLTSAGFLEGYKRGKANVDMELLSQYSEGVIALTGCLASRFCQRLAEDNRARGARPRRRADAGVRLGQPLLRGPEERHRAPGQGQRGHRRDRPRGRPAGGGHRRRALPGPRGLPQPLGAAVRADQEHAGRAEDVLRHQRVLPQGHGRDDGGVRGVARGGADHARDRRALRGGHRARQHAHPELPDAGRAARGRVPARPGAGRACASATATRSRPRRWSGWTWSSRSSAGWASTPTS